MEEKSLDLLLGEDVEIDSLMAFLKDISLFYEIWILLIAYPHLASHCSVIPDGSLAGYDILVF